VDKRLIYPNYNIQGARDVFNVTEDRRWLTKQAASDVYHPEIQKYIKDAKPIPDLIQVLITALGAHPFWPQNVNADLFPEWSLKHKGPDYGYETFLSNANYFTHHVNKDPSLAKGKVLATVWNDKAKRVELIIGINPGLDPDAATSLDNGESLCFSMGARLPYDVCTVCQNKAKTRAEYCDHLRYQMNQIDPDTGILVGAVNPFPKFFDISRVLIPADKTAYMWEKIASAAGHPLRKISSARLAELPVHRWSTIKDMSKTASVNKSATIEKRIAAISNPVAVEKLRLALSQVKHALDMSAPEIPTEVFNGPYNLNQCLSSMALLGVVPTRREGEILTNLFLGENGEGVSSAPASSDISIPLIKKIAPYASERSFYRPLLLQRIRLSIPLHKEAGIIDGTASLGVGITKGVFSALGALFGITGSLAPAAKMTEAMPQGLAGVIAKYPILAGILAAMAMNKIQGNSSKPLVSGNFTVADTSAGLYNNDWQRRFIQMQNRPATVIKTGAALKQSEDLVSPLTYLIMTSDLCKEAEELRLWSKVADNYLQHLQSQQFRDIIKSAAAIAPGEDLSCVIPEIGDFELIKNILK